MVGKRIIPVAFGFFILLIIIWLADPETVIKHFAGSDINFIAAAFVF